MIDSVRLVAIEGIAQTSVFATEVRVRY